METVKPVSTRESTDRLVTIIDITYADVDLKQVTDNATETNNEEITQLIILLKYVDDLFGGTLGDWYTYPTDLELNPYSKPFNCKYYPVPIIKNDTFPK